MIIYPAIDILEGKCVRLMQGRYDKSTVYSDNPEQMALRWEKKGAKYLHLVDLDGARSGKPMNIQTVQKILETVKIPVQLGGGIRTYDDMEMYIKMGVRRLILGTSAVESEQLVKKAVEKYGEGVAVGIDAKDGMVAISGWERVSNFRAVEFAQLMSSYGVKTIIYTDIATDGMLSGPNITAMQEMVQSVDADIIASGGVGSVADVKALMPTGVSGAIIGKALYTGNIKLEDCV